MVFFSLNFDQNWGISCQVTLPFCRVQTPACTNTGQVMQIPLGPVTSSNNCRRPTFSQHQRPRMGDNGGIISEIPSLLQAVSFSIFGKCFDQYWGSCGEPFFESLQGSDPGLQENWSGDEKIPGGTPISGSNHPPLVENQAKLWTLVLIIIFKFRYKEASPNFSD